MKTVFKAMGTRGALFVAISFFAVVMVYNFNVRAADMPVLAAPPTVSTQAAASNSAVPVAIPNTGTAMPDPSTLSAMPTAQNSGSDTGSKETKGLGLMEDKVPDAAKDAMKHLDSATDNLTLDDLNSARQAVAKLEALIDIEKHLAELDKIRQEREGGSNLGPRGMAAAIPMSALTPQPSFPQPQAPMPPMPVGITADSLEISRIVGSAGRYSAMIKSPDSTEPKIIQVGDTLTDGSKVSAITSLGVELNQNGNKRVVHVKNVNNVFGGTAQ